jgi:hypothetical protein
MEWLPGNPNDRSVSGFRIRHGGARGPMSVGFYNKLKSEGRGPHETVVDGVILILPDDEKAWDDARRNPSDDEAKLIAQKRAKWHKRALAAGAAAKRSPIHVSKVGRRKQTKHRRKG